MSARDFVDLLRLDPWERSALLDQLDRGLRERNREDDGWLSYRALGVPLLVHHPGGPLGRYLVTGWRLHANGIEVLHGGYVHQGSECEIELTDVHSDTRRLNARVEVCSLVSGKIHYVRLTFFRKVDPLAFLSQVLGEARPRRQKIAIARREASGAALCVSSDDSSGLALRTALESGRYKVTCVSSVGAARDFARRTVFDVVVVDSEVDGVAVRHVVDAVRKVGHRRTIVVLADEPLRVAAELDDDTIATIDRSPDREELLEVIASRAGDVPLAV